MTAGAAGAELGLEDPYGMLMEPGPTLVDPRVSAAAGRPPVHHLHPEFQSVVDRVAHDLSYVTGTKRSTVIPATGRGGIEAATASLGLDGQRILVLRNGEFGDMLHAIASRQRADVRSYDAPPARPFDLSDVERTANTWHPHLIMAVHSESSTGMLNDAGSIAAIARTSGALFLLDAVSSAGALALDADRIGADLTVTASQKALGALTGLSSVSWSDRALEALHGRSRDADQYYLDLRRWWDIWLTESDGGRAKPGARRLPWSMPTALVFALDTALGLLREETLETRSIRHSVMAERFRTLVREFGYSTLVNDTIASPSLTALTPPPHVTASDVVASVAAAGIRIAGGIGALGGRIVRVGHMAESARPRPLALTAVALGEAVGARIDLEPSIMWMEHGQ